MRPRLVYSLLGHRVYVVTRYTIKGTTLIAHTKYDVTEDFLALRKRRVRVRGAGGGR